MSYLQRGFLALDAGEKNWIGPGGYLPPSPFGTGEGAGPFIGPVSPFREAANAEEVLRVADLIGRAVIDPSLAAVAEGIGEAAAERAAIMGESLGAVPGLVSIPTTPTSGIQAPKTAARALGLRRRLRAVDQERQRSRLARMRCAVGIAARGHAVAGRPGFRSDYVAMLTLTYRGGGEWEPTHLTRFTDRVRIWCKRKGFVFRYVWVAELQKRGVIHYHFALWLPAGVVIPKPDRRGWWPYGASNVKQAQKPIAYLMKYLSKGADVCSFPKGARTHGAGGLEHSIRRAKRWCTLPGFIRARADINADWRRAPGGGWSDPDGVCIPSEYVRAWVGDRFACLKVVDYGRPFPVDGPYSSIERIA